jgi:hypothetical protein
LNCSFIIEDKEIGQTLYANYTWYNGSGSVYASGQVEVQNGTIYTLNISSSVTVKGQVWTCEILPDDGYVGGVAVNSSSVTIQNSLPDKVNLSSPANNSVTQDRNLTFVWNNVSDLDNDSLSFQIQVDDDVAFGAPEIDVSGITNLNYSSGEGVLSVDTVYYWRVRAADSGYGAGNGEWSDIWNFTIESLISLKQVVNSTDFGSMSPGTSDDTTDDSPGPLKIENDGNVLLNISVNATQLFSQASLGSTNYQFKVDNRTEPGSFNSSGSVTSFTPFINGFVLAVDRLKYGDSNDMCELDIYVSVPSDEEPGTKSSSIFIKGEIAE